MGDQTQAYDIFQTPLSSGYPLPLTLESTHFIFNKCPIYTHDDASAKFSTNSHETAYSVVISHDVLVG